MCRLTKEQKEYWTREIKVLGITSLIYVVVVALAYFTIGPGKLFNFVPVTYFLILWLVGSKRK